MLIRFYKRLDLRQVIIYKEIFKLIITIRVYRLNQYVDCRKECIHITNRTSMEITKAVAFIYLIAGRKKFI